MIRLWRAVATEDFVNFFKLLRGADFILAALMSRFVPRMRIQALRLLNKHTGKQGDTADTERITQLLCFDDVSECVQVCSQLELQCDRSALYFNPARPVLSSVPSLPLRLIAQKNTLEFGALVHGGQLPPLQARPPTFTQGQESAPRWESVLEGLAELEAAECLERELLSGLEAVAGEVLQEGREKQLIGQLTYEWGEKWMLEGILALVQGEAERELDAQREEQRRRKERNLFVDKLSEDLFEGLHRQLIGQLAAGELGARREQEALLSRVVEEVSLEAYAGLEGETVRELLLLEGDRELREARERRKERLEEQRKRVTTLRLRNLWRLWRDAREMRERRKEAVRKFPKVAPDWVPHQQWRLDAEAPGSFVSAEERERVSGWLRCERAEAERQQRQLRAPIDISALLGNSLAERAIGDWLLLVLIAGTEGSAVWPLEALTSEERADSACHVCTLADSDRGTEGRTRVRLVLGECQAGELKGCSGVLIIAGNNSELEAQERLDLLLGVGARPQVPLCWVHTHQESSEARVPPCVGEVRVSHVGPELSPAGKRELERALQWLAVHSRSPPRLMCLTLREYVSDRMYSLFCKEAAAHGAERERVGARGCPLGPTGSLFSAALECVREELTGQRAAQVNWPMNDHAMWEWNETGRLEEIRSCLDELALPSDLLGGGEGGDLFLDRCRHSLASYPVLAAEYEGLTTRHSSRYVTTLSAVCFCD